MNYLIVHDWNTTHGNHAGMAYMCRLLAEKYPNEFKVIVNPESNIKGYVWDGTILGKIRLEWNVRIILPLKKLWYSLTQFFRYLPMFVKLRKGDTVFIMEYLFPLVPYVGLAKFIRNHFPSVRICALSHFTVDIFKNKINTDSITVKRWAEPVDKMMTLGSSLSNYFEEQGIPKEKVSTGMHYVDADYYHKSEPITCHSPLRLITMGNLQRDYTMLAEIVRKTPNVDWTICRGRATVDDLFKDIPNVHLKGFLAEVDLRKEMENADVSVNVMKDTVGSNVITTSMAMGLAMIVSDVGSIRDYCSDDNALFCENTPESFVTAINLLANFPEKVVSMRQKSVELSKLFHIENIYKWMKSLSNN